MVLPLYHNHNAPRRFKRSFNTGLWYDKFFQGWARDWTIGDRGKRDWINQVTGIPVGERAFLKEAVLRLVMLAKDLGGECRCFATSWRFVTGLGRSHPVENGFAWHHTLGTPYLPGSSVKGMVRSWAENWVEVSPDDVNRLFGPREANANNVEKHIGSVLFFDALPISPVQLEEEVMTPHYQEYYQQEQPQLAPGDWYDPVPIPFLAVAPQQTFLFALAPRRRTAEQDREDFLLAFEWLTDALTAIGAGAKTTAGYGRFVREKSGETEINKWWQEAVQKLQQRETQKEEEAVSPVKKEMMQDSYDQDQEAFMRAMGEKWLKKLAEEQSSAEEKQEVALLLKQWYLTYRKEQWKKPNKKNKEKIALIKRVLGE
ncbi:MAG TPA: type III-B CRISPR module RAMP protein Cmr6 [Firmicutes bacterium]|jgi:CRISPR-associated protein Cmr6|nr:type III-B CRISPR module RAMP protein Cmr6 [Bacillota bacterium]